MEVTVGSLETLRRRGTLKWTTYPEDVLPLWVAESDFDTCPAVLRAISRGVAHEYLGYPANNGIVERALAHFQSSRFGWEIDPSWVRLVPDVVKGVAVAVEELTPAGSAIVLPVPSYYPFFDIPLVTSRPSVQVPLIRVNKSTGEPMTQGPTQTNSAAGSDPAANPPGADAASNAGPAVDAGSEWAFDYAELERVFANGHDSGAPIGSMILCSPYNPLGRVFRREELERLVELAVKYNVRLISDEIHSPIVYGSIDPTLPQHIPTASLSEDAARVTVTVLATSKGWNTAGLLCAQMILSNPEDRAAMARVHKLRTGEPSTLGALAAAAAYTDGIAWLDNELRTLSDNLDLLERRLPEVFPGARWDRPEATYLQWVDLSGVPGLATEPAKKIRQRAQVAFAEGTIYGAEGAGCVRINAATGQDILNEALDRIAAVDFTAEV